MSAELNKLSGSSLRWAAWDTANSARESSPLSSMSNDWNRSWKVFKNCFRFENRLVVWQLEHAIIIRIKSGKSGIFLRSWIFLIPKLLFMIVEMNWSPWRWNPVPSLWCWNPVPSWGPRNFRMIMITMIDDRRWGFIIFIWCNVFIILILSTSKRCTSCTSNNSTDCCTF